MSRAARVLMPVLTETVWDGLPVESVVRATAGCLEREFPGCLVWFGATTGHWWALVDSVVRWRLVEATDPYDLAAGIRAELACVSSAGRRAVRV